MQVRSGDQSEMWFRALLESAPVMIWMSGTDGACTHFNHGWLRYTGRQLADELGDGWAKGVHSDDLGRCLATYQGHFAERKPFRMEYRLRKADGEYGWVLDDGVPRFATDGAFLGFIGSCVDITEQKRAERALRSQSVAKALARRLLHDLIGRGRVPDASVRAFGRGLAAENLDAQAPAAYAEAFQDMGFGTLTLLSQKGARYEFTGGDLLECRKSAAVTCHLTLGYLEGAVAKLTNGRALGNEMSCQSMGNAECRFVVMAQ